MPEDATRVLPPALLRTLVSHTEHSHTVRPLYRRVHTRIHCALGPHASHAFVPPSTHPHSSSRCTARSLAFSPSVSHSARRTRHGRVAPSRETGVYTPPPLAAHAPDTSFHTCTVGEPWVFESLALCLRTTPLLTRLGGLGRVHTAFPALSPPLLLTPDSLLRSRT